MVSMALLRAMWAAATASVSIGPASHPMHTTLTEVQYGRESRALRLSVRVFADDFGTAASRLTGAAVAPDHSISDSAAHKYLSSSLELTDRDGRRIPLSWCGTKRTGDLVWICLSGSVPRGMDGVKVDARMLFDLYSDQVNIVQVTDGSRRQSLLFIKGGGPKELR